MTPQQLRNSILQMAIEGKLTRQLPEDGNAADLLKKIKAEKARLIKEKKIKKEKPLPEIGEDEVPFEIPDNWVWVRLGNVSLKLTDGSHNPPPNSGSGYKVISAMNIKNNIITFDNVNRYTDEKGFLKENERTNISFGDIILGIIGGSIGNLAYYYHNDKVIAQRSIAIINTSCLNEYIGTVLKTSSYQNNMKKSSGTAQGGIYLGKLKNLCIPIPPLGEQKRIVARLEEILPFVDAYEKAYNELQELNKKFPVNLKNSLLQMAIEGKLVEQRLEDGNAADLLKQIKAEKAKLIKEKKIKKEKPLPPITEDEIPFEIPDNWGWVRLGDITRKIGAGSTPSGGRTAYQENGVKFLRSQNVYNDGIHFAGIVYISEDMNKQKSGSIVFPKDILLNITGGSIGRCSIVPDDFDVANINQHILIIRNIEPLCRHYVHMVLISPYIQQMIMSVQVGVSREGLSAEKTKNFMIPLPPLAEQKRIVARLEQLLPLCDELMKHG
ncbi:MAG: restriction endonuclease subunit S [Anaerovibrio sp.]